MKRYYANIAPEYGKHLSHSDGKHGCNISAEDMDTAELNLRERAKIEGWVGNVLIHELNARGHQTWNPLAKLESRHVILT